MAIGQHNHTKEFGKLNSVIDFLTNAVVLSISPATKNLSLADNTLDWAGDNGFDMYVSLQLQKNSSDSKILDFANFTFTISVADTIANADTVPTILGGGPSGSATKVQLVNGVGLIKVTFPKGTYVANETITVTIANLTAPDGRTITGGTAVFTIA